MLKKIIYSVLTLIICIVVSNNVYSAIPKDYYQGTTGLTGEELKTKLHNIIKGHKEFSYKQLWEILKSTDEDPENPNNVILLYSGWSIPKPQKDGGILIWNREHVWAKSHGEFGTKKPAGTDLHHIRPADPSVNQKRSHLDFDYGGEWYIDPDGETKCKVDGDSWEPRDEVKGDIARMIFYMVIRYEGYGRVPDLELADKVSTTKTRFHGKKSILLKWHSEDPVNDWERRRNDRIYEKQKNRNPFIDHPEFVNRIWIDTEH